MVHTRERRVIRGSAHEGVDGDTVGIPAVVGPRATIRNVARLMRERTVLDDRGLCHEPTSNPSSY
jgi:hypothetical protein